MAVNIKTAAGKQVPFNRKKLMHSLKRSQAPVAVLEQVADDIEAMLRDGMSTKDIYKTAFALLKKQRKHHAARYKLKQAIFELGPTGFPFEQYVAALFQASGYQVTTNQLVSGKCVTHEVDVIATANGEINMMECKFHRVRGSVSDVKVALYVSARFRDVAQEYAKTHPQVFKGWLVTNTRLTEDAIKFATCDGLQVMGWNYPPGRSLRDMIDKTGLHPITSLTTLSNVEKQILLDRQVVLCKSLAINGAIDHLPGLTSLRRERILDESRALCASTYTPE